MTKTSWIGVQDHEITVFTAMLGSANEVLPNGQHITEIIGHAVIDYEWAKN